MIRSGSSSARSPGAAIGTGTAPGDHHRNGASRAQKWRSAVQQAAGRLLLIVCGLFLPLLALEVVFRQVGPLAPGEYQTAQLAVASDSFGRQNMANRSGWKRSREFSVHVRVNSKGLRGPDIPYEKAPGTTRVLVLGDSFTFGAQVDEEKTFVTRLGENLRASAVFAGGANRDVETINAGVDGWTTINELAWLRVEGLRYDPDLVVLMYFTGNDPGENFDIVKAIRRVSGPPDPVVSLPARGPRQALSEHSAVYSAFETGVLQKLLSQDEPATLDDDLTLSVRRSIDADRKEIGWELSGDLLRQLYALCKEHDVRLLVVGIPALEHVVETDRPPTPIRSIAERAGIPVVDLLDAFRTHPDAMRDVLYFKKDRHWTEAGHELAALEVADTIVRMQLLD